MCVKERLKNIPVNNDNIPVYTNLDQRINRTHRDEPKQTMNLHQARVINRLLFTSNNIWKISIHSTKLMYMW